MSQQEISIIFLSLKVAGLATLLCVPLAMALAYVLARKEFPGKIILSTLIHLPLLLPPVVTGYLLLVTFGRRGFVGGALYNWFGFSIAFAWTGAAVAAALMALPVVLQVLRVAIEAVDLELEEAATDLGASKWQRFMTIILPLIMPALLAAGVLGFVKALGEFGATITFVSNIPGETQTLALAIYSLLQTPEGDAPALRLMWFSIALAFGALLLSEHLRRKIKSRR